MRGGEYLDEGAVALAVVDDGDAEDVGDLRDRERHRRGAGPDWLIGRLELSLGPGEKVQTGTKPS